MKSTIFSIGHGNKSIEDFVNELKSFKVEYLIDIRSKPYSKYYPHFNRYDLKKSIEENGFVYAFMGNKLGGLPEDLTCYTNGKVDYNKLAEKEFFKEGIQRLVNAHENEYNVAIMCSEKNPKECHRTKLIGQVLGAKNIILNHIVSVGKIKDQTIVMSELTKGLGTTDLFGDSENFTSRKKYL